MQNHATGMSPSRDLTIQRVEGGFPHSEILGSKLVRSSPRLIAAYHVLHRLSAPRHPPDALKTLDRSHDPCPPSFNDSMCCSPRTLGRGAQAIRKTCSRLSPGTFLLAKWTRRTALRGPCAGGQRQCAGSSRIHSLFTISNTRTPSHKEQNARVSCDPRGSQRTAPRVSLTFRTADPSGGARRDRTDDLMLAKHALSQLSYGPMGMRRPRYA